MGCLASSTRRVTVARKIIARAIVTSATFISLFAITLAQGFPASVNAYLR